MTSWTLRPSGDAVLVEFTGDYNLPLGLRLVGDRAVEQLVGGQVRRSLVNLRHAMEGAE